MFVVIHYFQLLDVNSMFVSASARP